MNVPFATVYVCQFIRSVWVVLLVLLVTQAVAGCASPSSRLMQVASDQGFSGAKINAGGFSLQIFDNQSTQQSQRSEKNRASSLSNSPVVLRIYLEGDGLPWRYRVFTMADPTSRSPLMLKLMALDPNPAVYLGRPCYNGTHDDPSCNMSLWTSGRYSATVVQNMASAIRRLAKRRQVDELWLLGYSGGGAMAMLLAAQLDKVTRLITIAGNLDTDAWTEHHSYTPLYSSFNPATLPPLRKSVKQWHLLGARDRVIPPSLVRAEIARQGSAAHMFIFPRYSHGCCWENLWPDLMDALAADDPGKIPGRKIRLKPE